MRIKHRNAARHTRQGLFFVVTALAASCAQAAIGVDVSGRSSSEDYVYTSPAGKKSISSQKITVSPWWSNEDWRISADIPFIQRDATYSGTFSITRYSLLLHRYVTTPVTLTGSESDSGLGDTYLNVTRSWSPRANLSTYLGAHVRVPTGNPDSSPGSVTASIASGSQRYGVNDYSLGTDGVDVRIAPGATLANELAWFSVEPAYVWTNSQGLDSRPAAYVGVGITPWKYVDASVSFDYEGESVAGGGTLEQVTYAITLKPVKHLGITLSTYTDLNDSTLDGNLSLGLQAYR